MSRPWLPGAIALLASAGAGVALAACSAGSREAVTVTVTVDRPAETRRVERPPADLRDTARVVEGKLRRSPSGHLAYVGADDNVYVVDPLTGATAQVTDDRSSADTEYGILHTGLAWSRTGELAFARTDADAFASTVFVTVPGSGKVMRVARRGGMLIYASWSPAGCGELTCSELALVTDVDREPGGNVRLNVLSFPTPSSARSVLEEEGPQIYFSWAGSHGRLVQHVVGADIVRDESRLEELELASGASRRFAKRLAPFLAPAFAAGRVVYAVADSRGDEATVTVTRSAVVVHAPRDVRRVAFAPSPDGKRLAFAVRKSSQAAPEQAFDDPRIVDLRSGEVARVGPPTLWTEAFYWSPDGTRLAYLTYLDSGYRPYNQWRIFDASSQEDRGSISFQPTSTFDTLTTFFDQFGQSHSLWSPDGRYLTYAAVSADNREQVWLVDTRREGRRVLVADAAVGVFSWR